MSLAWSVEEEECDHWLLFDPGMEEEECGIAVGIAKEVEDRGPSMAPRAWESSCTMVRWRRWRARGRVALVTFVGVVGCCVVVCWDPLGGGEQ